MIFGVSTVADTMEEPQNLRDAKYPEEIVLYKITDHEWRSPDNHRWGPGTRCDARQEVESTGKKWIGLHELSTHFNKPRKVKLIQAYTHPVLAALLYRGHMSVESPILWDGNGEVAAESDDNRVYCNWIRVRDIVPMPVISDETRMKFGFGAVYKVYQDERFRDYILDWVGGKDRDGKLARELAEYTNKQVQNTQKDKAGKLANGEAIAAFAAHWMCFAAIAFGDPAKRDDRLTAVWTANAALEANRAAKMMKKPIDLVEVAELTMMAR